jgi:hypothetical protein
MAEERDILKYEYDISDVEAKAARLKQLAEEIGKGKAASWAWATSCTTRRASDVGYRINSNSNGAAEDRARGGARPLLSSGVGNTKGLI